MADITTQQLNEFQANLSAVSRQLGMSAKEAERLTEMMGYTNAKYTAEARKFIKGESQYAKDRRAQYVEAKKAHDQAMKLLEEKNKVEIKTTNELKTHQRALLALRQKQQELETNRASLDQLEYESRKNELERERAQLREKTSIARNAANEARSDLKVARANQQIASTNVMDFGRTVSVGRNLWNNAVRSMTAGMAAIPAKLLGGLSIQQGVSEIYRSLLKQVDTGISMSLSNMATTAQKFGLGLEEYTQVVADNRRALLSTGGIDNFNKSMEWGTKRFRGSIGDLADRSKYVAEQMSILANSGVRPTESSMNRMGYSMERLSKLTGMTAAQFNSHMNDILEDESTRNTLRAAASEADRRALIEGAAKQLELNVAMGMTVEQAKAAAKALNKMAGESPIDRIKKAARMRAMGGALGIEGSQEAANIMMLGQRATAEQKQQLQEFMTKMSNTVSASQTGSMSGEIMTATLVDKLGFKGELEVFNTRLAEPLKASAAAMASLDDKTGKMLQNQAQVANELLKWLNNPLVQIIGGAVAGAAGTLSNLLGSVVEGLITGKMMRGALPGTGGVVPGAAGGAARALPGVAGGAMGALGTGAALLGAGAAGYGIGTLINDAIGGDIAKVIDKITGLEAKNAELLAPTPITPRTSVKSDETKEVIKQAEKDTAKTVSSTDKMVTEQSTTNKMLETLVELTEDHVDVSKKLLTASILSDEERRNLTQQSGGDRMRGLREMSTNYNVLQ